MDNTSMHVALETPGIEGEKQGRLLSVNQEK